MLVGPETTEGTAVSEGKARRPRMADIAREANVNRITVSRALSRPELVAKDTLKRIEAAIARTGYIPNQVARGMRSERSSIVSLAAPAQMSGVYGAISERLAEALHSDGLIVNHFPFTDSLAQREAAVREMAGWCPAVIVVMSGLLTEPMRAVLRVARTPLVELLSYDPESPGSCVGFDNRAAARQLAEHLLGRGYRRITYVHSANPLNALNATRLKGFTDAMEAAPRGARAGELAVAPGFAEGAALIERLVTERALPDALLCASDMVAVGALEACHRLGIGVPGDVALCAVDGTELTRVIHPPITSLDFPLARVAEVGAEEIRRLALEPGALPRRVRVEARVRPGATT